MAQAANNIDVYLEIGKKRTFAGAIEWPGWCRSGRDEGSALQALLDYGPRYASMLRAARLGFHAPADVAAFVVVERLAGNTTTDFGAPDVALSRGRSMMPSFGASRRCSVRTGGRSTRRAGFCRAGIVSRAAQGRRRATAGALFKRTMMRLHA
jgi:hypothetical protein